MSLQTIFKAGNSKVVSIPSDIFRELDLKIGQKVAVEKIDDDNIIIKKQVTTKNKSVRSHEEFSKWLNSTLKEDAEILDELANR